ncbi:hypothetical protein F2P81_017369 [Scophthalmus maximus]|uniref:Uncharacterized protein n=1 Tax=Scophthalmus maximus TaxID=52904 RepID=A0A6A4SEH0_SCOMX|nr:hypothetical protein F2P81_017369 [Scophthalmus maximus]
MRQNAGSLKQTAVTTEPLRHRRSNASQTEHAASFARDTRQRILAVNVIGPRLSRQFLRQTIVLRLVESGLAVALENWYRTKRRRRKKVVDMHILSLTVSASSPQTVPELQMERVWQGGLWVVSS